MVSPTLSLRTQLLITFVWSIVVAVVALTTIAYKTSTANLQRDAHQNVLVAAENRADVVSRLVDEQRQRASGFLTAAAALCGEMAPSGRISWELNCAQQAVHELRSTERARAALLTQGTRRLAASGAPIDDTFPVDTHARLVDTRDGMAYVVSAANEHVSLRLQYALSDLFPLFEQSPLLGSSSEVFLRTGDGALLTPGRFASSDGGAPRTAGNADRQCPTQPTTFVADDYRGVRAVHGVYPVKAFSTPTCVDAHVSHAEALAPAGVLLHDLVVPGTIFTAIAVLMALIAATGMTYPLRRLAASARAIAAGDFTKPVPVGGPSEVRKLARSFSAMTGALGEMMTREQQARKDAEAANRAKDEFLAVLSHELRTPLTATLGWTHLLRNGHLEGARADRALDAIERSTMTQSRLIEDLLDVSRFIAGRLELQATAVSLAEPVRLALEGVRPAAEDKQVILQTFCDAAPLVVGDPLRLQQIIINLLTNAVKFTPAGGTVTVGLREIDGQAELWVTDTGIGIAPDFLPHVFEQFRQADGGSSRVHGGLGLGLAIVRHLVDRHGGTVEASSPGKGAGATFTVRIPVATAAALAAIESRARAEAANLTRARRLVETPASVASHATSTEDAADAGRRLKSVRILLVEDDDDTRLVVGALLEDAGATVVAAANAEDARTKLESAQYDVIVSDIAMPREDGYSFMRTVRASRRLEPAIALTALARRDHADQAVAAGFQVHLTKPVDRERLIATVASLTLQRTA
jgi:signal transduction histidine kinase/CheY-like chemotaxis protein